MTSIVLKGDIKKFERFASRKGFKEVFGPEMNKGMKRNSLILMELIKKKIRGSEFEKNATLTLLLKRSDIPLIGDMNLIRAIDFKLRSSFESEVGIISNKKSTGGITKQTIGMQKLAALMETGYTIKVTKKMLMAIMASLSEKQSGLSSGQKKGAQQASNVLGGAKANSTFRVPPRPFLTKTFEDPQVHAKMQRIWNITLSNIFKKLGAL